MVDEIYIPIKIKSILFYFAFFCLTIYTVMESSTTSLSFMPKIRVYSLWTAALCCSGLLNEVFSYIDTDKYGFCIFSSVLFIASIIFGWIFGGKVGSSGGVIRMSVYIVEILILMIVAKKENRTKYCVRILFMFCIIMCFINDFVDITGLISFTKSRYSILKKYVIGTKFDVVYLHLNTVTLLTTNEILENRFDKKRVCLTYIALAAVLAISVYVDCSTGVIGSVVFAALFSLLQYGNDGVKKFLYSKYTFMITLLAAAFILLILQAIVNLPVVTNFIVNTLKRDVTLTGRLIIFMLFIPTMNGHWFWGYGLGKAYSVSMSNFGAADAQNLVLQWVLQIGVVPITAMLLWIMSYFSRIDKCNNKSVILPIVVLLYTYVLLGIGEITLNYNFFMFLFLLSCISNYSQITECI
ncbi:O-antigen ligase family protein [Oribacterium sp. P6A1]|uniref:O-antigen ligase family protein n=1 Tax=Oribacterium sp. P6A1 TaxID=1410612 RepID=UPI0005698511|nr:hypothetical protein [Oribacterium sp. P6A1]